ncbi:unnamed protein product [Adineta steineri]|uniref:NHL repeat containing protein n=3 Tax=Adineta steineri TaxID=433720 RepID=A0A813R1J9_9BILA|nr:unnamed protein product [Adineta steineri]
MLNSPQGIYVDSNLNLYIADSANNRIQFVQTGQLNGVTIAGNGSSTSIILNYPTGIVLDANGYLFIVDSYNHRIVASSSSGFRCIVGCSGGGSSASQLSYPQSMAFDSYGNIYVTDRNNSRVQQFTLQSNTCVLQAVQPLPPLVPLLALLLPLVLQQVAAVPQVVLPRAAVVPQVAPLPPAVLQLAPRPQAVLPQVALLLPPVLQQVVPVLQVVLPQVVVALQVAPVPPQAALPVLLLPPLPAVLLRPLILPQAAVLLPAVILLQVPLLLPPPLAVLLRPVILPQVALLPPPPAVLLLRAVILLQVPLLLLLVLQQVVAVLQVAPAPPQAALPVLLLPAVILLQVPLQVPLLPLLLVRAVILPQVAVLLLALTLLQVAVLLLALILLQVALLLLAVTLLLPPRPVVRLRVATVLQVALLPLAAVPALAVPQVAAPPPPAVPQVALLPLAAVPVVPRAAAPPPAVVPQVALLPPPAVPQVVPPRAAALPQLPLLQLAAVPVVPRAAAPPPPPVVVPQVALLPLPAVPRVALLRPVRVPQILFSIYVDSNLNLYIADSANNRIQFVQTGQLNGVAIAGNGSSTSIILNYPTGIVLDANGYLFIVDSYNHRIVGSSSSGFRCLIGCSGGGSTSSQLSYPQSMAFDSYGNIYVTDRNNSRVQQFTLQSNNCILQQVAAVPQVVLPRAAVVPQVALLPPAVLQLAPRPQAVLPQVALLLPPVLQQVVAVLQVVLPRVAVVLQVAPAPPQAPLPVLLLPAVILLQVALLRPVTLPQAALLLPAVTVLQVAQLQAPLPVLLVRAATLPQVALLLLLSPAVPLRAATLLQVALLLPPLPAVLVRAVTLPQVALPLPPRPVVRLRVATVPQVALLPLAAVPALVVPQVAAAPPPPPAVPQVALLPLAAVPALVAPRAAAPPLAVVRQVALPRAAALPQLPLLPLAAVPAPVVPRVAAAPPPAVVPRVALLPLPAVPQVALLRLVRVPQVLSTRLLLKIQHNLRKVLQDSTIISSTTSITTSQQLDIHRSCYAPTITLIPSQSSLASPLQFRRSQDFSISSIIGFNCNGSLARETQWTVKNCTSSSCLSQIQLNEKVITTLSEFYAPAKTFAYGIYELTLTVTMTKSPSLKSSSSAYVRITPTGITPNLVELGTSMVTRGHQQNLLLDPGTFSVDPDEDSFNASKWKYEYYCRVYDESYNFPNLQGILLSIDDPRVDPLDPSCLSSRSDNGTQLIFGNLTLSPKSSLTILGGSLQSNRTYQFMVYMENRQNSSLQATGYVLVTVTDTQPQLVAVGCVIGVMCVPNQEFQVLNPTTQVALFTVCVDICPIILNISWNVYQGEQNSSSNSTQWSLFNDIILYENIWFFGKTTSNFTATNQLFLDNPTINFWRFEVVYTFITETSSSALNFVMNQSPTNGSCSINPQNGSTSTLFTISCPHWFDEDGIQDYSVFVWTKDSSEKIFIAFSPVPDFQVRLPSGDNQTSLLNIMIYVRDLLDCVTQVNMSSINVVQNSTEINSLIVNLQSFENGITNNEIVQLLSSGNQNIVGQVITSLSQQLNQMNSQSIDKAISNGISVTSISISSLTSTKLQQISVPLNVSALVEYEKDLNNQANVRDYIITFITDLAITTSNSIILQATSLVQLTQSTNQLTRAALMLITDRCYQLTVALQSMSTRISYENAQMASTQLIQCASNILTAVNGPLQERTIVLDLDSSRANTLPTDYDTDLESDWSNPNLFADGNDFSRATIDKNRNIYYQKQLANEITNKTNKIISLLTSSLNIQLNIGQNSTINTSQTFMSLSTISINSLSNKQIQQIDNAQFNIPSNININITNNSPISIRSIMNTLASFDKSQSNTNLSRLISLSILDQYGNQLSFETNANETIQLIIPRDQNLLIPNMILQNVTATNTTLQNQLFYLSYINITNQLSISVHFEISPLNINLAYLFIYKFDQTPLLNSSINFIDGWTLFCPSTNLTNETIYKYFINNQQTYGHQSLIFGLRELNSTEFINYCSNNNNTNNDLPITDEKFNFTSNYQLRIYTSGCYYLDQNNQYKSDGVIVGPLTNHYETECLSSHLTSFAGGFIVLPEPINWSYVFANAGFMKNKTIYLTIICMSIAYIILMIFGRYKDKKDIEKLGVTPLPDNDKSDQYYYQIIVFTGQRANSGTQSKVHFILSSDNDETRVRTFSDPHRKIFQRVYVDDVLTSLLGFCCFFGTIKFIKFIRFNKSLIIFVQTLKYVTKDIISFSFMFSIVFMSFLALFYLLFNSSIGSCSSLLSTAQMLFEITLMSFDATDFTGADPFLGPFCFSIFIIIVVFVCLSMFMSILNDGFHHVEEIPIEDQHILSYMLKKFLNWTHLRRPNVEEIYELHDSRMHSQYVDSIENFPDKIDQLLEAIDRIYIDQRKELLKLKRLGV